MPVLKVEEGRVVRTPFNELVERLAQAEEALQRAEVELLAQTLRIDALQETLRTEFNNKHYFMDVYSARSMAEARRDQVPINELFTSANFHT